RRKDTGGTTVGPTDTAAGDGICARAAPAAAERRRQEPSERQAPSADVGSRHAADGPTSAGAAAAPVGRGRSDFGSARTAADPRAAPAADGRRHPAAARAR